MERWPGTRVAGGGSNYGAFLVGALGFERGRVPSVGTLFTIFSRVDKDALEKAINGWAEQVLTLLPDEGKALSGDGKWLRGSHARGAADTLLLWVVSHRLGLTVLQKAVPDATNEHGALPDVLRELVLHGRILTLDAAPTHTTTAHSIVEKGAIIS